MKSLNQALAEVIESHDGVLSTETVLRHVTEKQLRCQISSGRWQKPDRGIVVAHAGPLTQTQVLRVALLRAGPRSVLAGITAARLDGLKGFADNLPFAETSIHLLVPYGFKKRAAPLGLTVVTHHSQALTEADVHPVRAPKRTRIARSIVDAAAWMPTDRGAMAVLAAGVQQGLVRTDHLSEVAARNGTVHRRKLIRATLADIEGGAQALSELDFTQRVVRAFGLPEPSRQVARRDSRGRRRWIDVVWDKYKVVVEIDGAQHTEDPLQRWDDMERDIDFGLDGYLTLRFPAWLTRKDPAHVAHRTLQALRRGGYSG